MGFWNKLFPKYDCKKCKDTFVIKSQYMIARCDCPGSMANVDKMLNDFNDFVKKVGLENMGKYVP